MKLILLILAIALFGGCDIIEPVGVDIKGVAPAKQQPATNPIDATARQLKRGLWAGMGPDDQVPPWEWRKR